MKWSMSTLAVVLLPLVLSAAEPSAAERGEKALLGKSFNPPTWSPAAYQKVWTRWTPAPKEAPANYDEAFRAYYGLHAAPYANGELPMGLRSARGLLGKGISTDCMICHGGSIHGKSYVGLPNSTLDIQALFEDLSVADGKTSRDGFSSCNVRGTTEAGAFAVLLLSLRNPDLSLSGKRLDLELHDDLCEDAPAWWLLKKKQSMYHTGGSDARSVRSIMQFMLTPLNSPSDFEAAEKEFRDIRAYLLSLQPPKYPLPINADLARKGEAVFTSTCARCHGSYGANPTYPNRIIPLDEIGTDAKRFHGISRKFYDHYNASWFAKETENGYAAKETAGYQAPPLDGIWATAPYFHNGSAPTVYHVLNSKARPRVFTRSYRTEKNDYDPAKLGWKIELLEKGADPQKPAVERRRIYNTTQPGRGNGGHTFGDKLTEEERMAVIEYLKTL